jgi:hypothetical protein
VLVVVDLARTFYPPAAAAWGVDLQRLIVVHPKSARDALWAAGQSLRSPAVAAVWAALDRIDDRAFRRLQLAAEAARAVGLIVRPASARGQPSWADVRLGVENCGLRIADCGLTTTIRNPKSEVRNPIFCDFHRRLQIRLLRCRHGRAGGAVVLEIDDAGYTVREASANDDAHPLPVAAELADSASARGAG